MHKRPWYKMTDSQAYEPSQLAKETEIYTVHGSESELESDSIDSEGTAESVVKPENRTKRPRRSERLQQHPEGGEKTKYLVQEGGYLDTQTSETQYMFGMGLDHIEDNPSAISDTEEYPHQQDDNAAEIDEKPSKEMKTETATAEDIGQLKPINNKDARPDILPDGKGIKMEQDVPTEQLRILKDVGMQSDKHPILVGMGWSDLHMLAAETLESLAEVHRAMSMTLLPTPVDWAETNRRLEVAANHHPALEVQDVLPGSNWAEMHLPTGVLFISDTRLTDNRSKEACDADRELFRLTNKEGIVEYYLANHDSQVVVARWTSKSEQADAEKDSDVPLLRLRGGCAEEDLDITDQGDGEGSELKADSEDNRDMVDAYSDLPDLLEAEESDLDLNASGGRGLGRCHVRFAHVCAVGWASDGGGTQGSKDRIFLQQLVIF
ncbi:hypothetical protein K474DRAFT_1701868 [Panus rudis PR-1116 ss-1]|nr:hypothetical protein K474DRAFT_1701868 [Panus rudis PR-1116 ss-1]